jgi:hypothetical protein
MESTITPSEFFQVSEIDLIYKSKVKASLLGRLQSLKTLTKSFYKFGMLTRRSAKDTNVTQRT